VDKVGEEVTLKVWISFVRWFDGRAGRKVRERTRCDWWKKGWGKKRGGIMAPQRQGEVKGGERNEGEEGRLKHRCPPSPYISS